MITSSFISKNLRQSQMTHYMHTAMVSHRGTPISFAMRDNGKIVYSVLNLSSAKQDSSNQQADGEDQENDKLYWSNVVHGDDISETTLRFPKEIAQVGYGVVPNREVGNFYKKNGSIVASTNENEIDVFYSTTARLGAVAPFQALSDGKYIYIFRQSVGKNDANNIKEDSNAIVDNTLLVDRFILSGTTLKLSREIRYQRSRHKTEPQSRKDTLSAVDIEGKPFYEPTRELAFVDNLSSAGGNFSVLLLPGASAEEHRWQIFSYDTVTQKINSFNIKFDFSIVFDTSDSEDLVNAFIEQYSLDEDFINDVQTQIGNSKTDTEIITASLSQYNSKNLPTDGLAEIIYTIRKGVSKDDFTPASVSEWPLIEYTEDGSTIKSEFLDSNKVLESKYAFSGDNDELTPSSVRYEVKNGLSSCYYYQQEIQADNKSMKTKACVMLTMGLEDKNNIKYIGILNFSTAVSGKLSRLTKDMINLPDINIQALDENQYKDLASLNQTSGQNPQKMSLLDIDNNGLSTSGGVLKFAYTSSDQAVSEGYSDATEATFPNVFDDSLGRVNLYFKGKNDNFFVMYFNPTGSKSLDITDNNGQSFSPALVLKPRLDIDLNIHTIATPNSNNTTALIMKSKGNQVEKWINLPKRVAQIVKILNGKSELSLAKLDSLKVATDINAAYLKPSSSGMPSSVVFRTTKENNLMFNASTAFDTNIVNGQEHSVALSDLSTFLENNKRLTIAQKSFEIASDVQIKVKSDVLYKSYLSGLVGTTNDINTLWDYLKTSLVTEIPTNSILNASQTTTINDGANFNANDTTLSVSSMENFDINQGDYIKIGSEILRILNIYGNDLEVSRGQLSSVAANHANGATVTHDACLLNGQITNTGSQIVVTAAATLGIVKGDIIQIGSEKLLISAISGNELTVVRAANSTSAANHNNGSKISMFQKGVPNTQGNLTENTLIGTQTTLTNLITDTDIKNLNLDLLSVGNEADKKNRRASLRQNLIALLLDVAKVRLLTFSVRDINIDQVDRLAAGLAVNVVFNYENNFDCTPANSGSVSASKWEHPRSYLFNASLKDDSSIDALTEITSSFNYAYNINNTIGQWEDWEASLALEFKPSSATNGALLTTSDTAKLPQLSPTEKGLSVEAWIKPNGIHGTTSRVLYYNKDGEHYSLGIEKEGTSQYKCIATLGTNKYKTTNSFNLNNANWKHLAFTHRKYWGYRQAYDDYINCGNDDSLHLNDEFTLEALVQIDSSGTLLKKTGEYTLAVNTDRKITFSSGGDNHLVTDEQTALTTGLFYKITLIRSREKPKTDPTQAEYPITGGDEQQQSSSSSDKWYEGKDDSSLLKGMAEKQDQMETKMDFAQSNMFGNTKEQQSLANPEYWHTLIITDTSGNLILEWQSSDKNKVNSPQKYKDFIIGGDGFTGSFDSVLVWQRALSKGDAKLLDLPNNKEGLVSHWRMVEGKDKYLYDNTSENHGVASAGTWEESPRTGQPGQFQFYVDGQYEAHETIAGQSISSVNQFSVGGYKTSSSNSSDHFKGVLEEIRVWNKPRTNEQITDNTFGRLKGELDQLLANYTFDTQMESGIVKDASITTANLTLEGNTSFVKEVLSTAPVATEIPQIRSALTGVKTDYHGTLKVRPQVVEYGDVQKNEDGTLSGILKRCYSFIDKNGKWNRMTGYKVGNLISQWYGQAQFAPQVMGFLEGPPPVPAENFPVGKDADVDTYAYKLDNSIAFKQAEEVSYNYSTSKEAGWNVAMNAETKFGLGVSTLVAPFGIGLSFEVDAGIAAESNWETSGKRSESYERGVSVNTDRSFSATLAGYDNGLPGSKRYYKLGNTGYALVKSKTADIYLLRLEHNNALVSISWQPNPDIPEDVNILPFPINPLYTKQGTLDGKFGDTTDNHYPQAHGAYGEYSYYKPREAYKLKKEIDREKAELRAYFEDSFDVSKTNGHFKAAAAVTGLSQLFMDAAIVGPLITSIFNQTAGQIATQVGYNNTKLKDDLANMGSQRNLANTYVWTIEGGFYAESTEVAETQQETYSSETSLSLGGGVGIEADASGGGMFEQKNMFSSGSSFTLTKSRTKEAKNSFSLDVSVDIPTSPRYKYAGVDGRSLVKGLISPGTVDAYRFMSFYLEPKGKNFTDLFSEVIDPIWLDQSPDPNAQALRQARGNMGNAKPCWRIMHRVTYVSRILPEFTPEAPPSLEKSTRAAGFESNYSLIKRFEPYIKDSPTSEDFFNKIEQIIDTQLPEFTRHKQQIKMYLALYFNVGMT